MVVREIRREVSKNQRAFFDNKTLNESKLILVSCFRKIFLIPQFTGNRQHWKEGIQLRNYSNCSYEKYKGPSQNNTRGTGGKKERLIL